MASEPVEIVLVEDNPNDVELAVRVLRKYNIANSIEVVRDGAEALEFMFCEGRYAARRPDCPPKLVLVDLKMPRVDGLEVIRRLKSDERTRTIPVVALTSSREERDIAASYAVGVNSYIVKPVDFDQFSEAVHQLGMYWMLLNQGPVRSGR